MEYTSQVKKIIGQFFRELIDERNLVIEQITRETGLSKTIIYAIINGKGYTMDSLVKLCRHLQIHIEFSEMSADNNIHTMTGNKPSLN